MPKRIFKHKITQSFKKCRVCKKNNRYKTITKISSYCKICKNKKERDRLINKYGTVNGRKYRNLEKFREYDKKYQIKKRRLNPDKKRKEVEDYFYKYPERKNVSAKVQFALKKGKLKKEICRDCARKDVQGHHEDYSKPLDVVWLCPVHHKLQDIKNRIRAGQPIYKEVEIVN